MGGIFGKTPSNKEMVETQIAGRGIRDQRVLQAFADTDRIHFVIEEKLDSAYQDNPLPIGFEQTISQPYMVAEMTELLELEPTDRVLEIGTGSGYQTAILSKLASEVYTVEIIPELSLRAQSVLKKLGVENVMFKTGSGYEGWLEYAPFDAIIVTAAPEQIPDELVKQLTEGGRMVLPVGLRFQIQTLYRIDKIKGKSHIRNFGSVAFVPMVGKLGETH
jgi:protein-L-isoaspartate(D-aspartate) O-methyltransferase